MNFRRESSEDDDAPIVFRIEKKKLRLATKQEDDTKRKEEEEVERELKAADADMKEAMKNVERLRLKQETAAKKLAACRKEHFEGVKSGLRTHQMKGEHLVEEWMRYYHTKAEDWACVVCRESFLYERARRNIRDDDMKDPNERKVNEDRREPNERKVNDEIECADLLQRCQSCEAKICHACIIRMLRRHPNRADSIGFSCPVCRFFICNQILTLQIGGITTENSFPPVSGVSTSAKDGRDFLTSSPQIVSHDNNERERVAVYRKLRAGGLLSYCSWHPPTGFQCDAESVLDVWLSRNEYDPSEPWYDPDFASYSDQEGVDE